MTALGFLVYAFVVVASSFAYNNDDECIFPFFDRAHITATSLPERGPYNARLHGNSAWSSELSSYSQHLTMELGDIYEIRSIFT